ncbi:MAG: tRNA (N6-isopentenyl adenosine(37)-C2)-methylthiotransferase MiaB [Clostridia bacterium]|nr:tRNA (N6-isopentenyl adenosine(37)-C2)-methylthiotransferase MiaB [Clostridia bacterium]
MEKAALEAMARMAAQNRGKNKKALVETYGCQANVNDSQRLMGMLLEMGYTLTSEREEADVILFNTCAVRDGAEQRVFGNLGALKNIAEKRGTLIGVCGCMAQQSAVAQRIRTRYRFVDLVFGTHAQGKFPILLEEALTTKERVCDISENTEIAEGVPTYYGGGAKAFVSIMYGCDNFCSYCIVPYVRGRERSRREEDILAEICALTQSGVKEIMLLGQNVNSYGNDFGEKDAFSRLLRRVSEVEGLERIRFMSSHPKDLSFTLLETMAQYSNIPHQLHLPLQSGSNKVLKDMNRRYSRERYLEIVEYARSLMPDLALTTDIIVGFPTETEEDFLQTCDMLERIRCDSIFSFIYSPRQGTAAAKMENVSTKEEQAERFKRMLELQNTISLDINRSFVGKVQRVLTEGVSKTDAAMLTGRNEANKIVNFPGSEDLKDKFVDVKITRAQTWVLQGELI